MTAIKRFITVLEQLNDTESNTGTYYAECSADPRELELCIKIEGCGDISLPLSNDVIQKMLTATAPAKFGLYDQTLYDKEIRDTNEIAADKININYNTSKFALILDDVKNKLGLSGSINLKAKLHNILIYSKDQFFSKHQDTEKLDDMLATLVMVLPSPHIGGTLSIEHYGETAECKSENINSNDIKFIAFYSDCRHEVKKVVDGYRVVATYNLIAESSATITASDIDIIKKHQDALKEAMLAALKEETDNSPTSVPCITYLLNHQYTKHGLSWGLLRGCDRLRTEIIKAAAREADCELLLALVEARETWTTEGGYRYGDSNEGEEPQDLIDSEIDIVHAIDIESKTVKYNQHISEKALCYHLPNDAFKPFETEYEGYMGNYGNTVDYRYHRAAVVIWKKSDNFVLSFLNDPNAAIKGLVDNAALDINFNLKRLWPYWHKYKVSGVDLRLLLELAILVNEPTVAEKILQHCSSSSILQSANDFICRLFAHYKQEWAAKTLDNWLKNPSSQRDNEEAYNEFSNIIQDFVNNRADSVVINKLIKHQIHCIKTSDLQVNIEKPISLAKTVASRVYLIIELIEALQIIGDTSTETEVLDYIISKPNLYTALELIKLLTKIKAPELRSLLKNHILSSLHNEITIGLRSVDDWHIDSKSKCKCECCKVFNEFMRSKTEIHKRWPLRQDLRLHVVDMMRMLEVPIDYHIEEKGSPYKLLLTKSSSIYSNAEKRFEAVCIAYQELLSQ